MDNVENIEDVLPDEAVDEILGKNGIEILSSETGVNPETGATNLIMLIKTDMHDGATVKVTLEFNDEENDDLNMMYFEGPDEFTEEEGKEILQKVMESFIDLLNKAAEAAEQPTEDAE